MRRPEYPSFAPMATPKVVSQEQMQAVLKKHAKVDIQSARDGISEGRAPSAAVEHPVTAATLKWKRLDGWTIATQCGRFKIRKEVDSPAKRDSDATFRYRAYRFTGAWDFELGATSDPQKARGLCDASAQERP